MNVFVLCTGRCGSVTLAKACRHIGNYTSGHETRVRQPAASRVAYPPAHIEIDNRLAYFLGALQEQYGNGAHYVHLIRDRHATAASFNRRWHMRGSIMRAYVDQICLTTTADPLAACLDYVDTVNANIRAFLRDKPSTMTLRMEHHSEDFPAFWQAIGADGDLAAAMREWETAHNASAP